MLRSSACSRGTAGSLCVSVAPYQIYSADRYKSSFLIPGGSVNTRLGLPGLELAQSWTLRNWISAGSLLEVKILQRAQQCLPGPRRCCRIKSYSPLLFPDRSLLSAIKAVFCSLRAGLTIFFRIDSTWKGCPTLLGGVIFNLASK